MLLVNRKKDVEKARIVFENETRTLDQMKTQLTDLKQQKKRHMRFEKATAQMKRQRTADGFKADLISYMNQMSEGKCEFAESQKRRCKKDAVKELDGKNYCNAHWGVMAEKKLKERKGS